MERVGWQLSFQDWEQIFQDFRGSHRAKWLSQCPGLAILEQALYIVAKKDYPSKSQLLTFIEENIEVLIGEDDTEEGLGSVVEALRTMLEFPADGLIVTSLLKEQMMTTATVAMVVVDSLHRASHQLEMLIELLLGVINRPNHGADRQARGIACECLRELERNYPCLLHASAGHILFLFQSERTHVTQSYALLLTTILHNLACYMYTAPGARSTAVNSFLSTTAPLTPFSVPSFLVASEPGEEALSVPSREFTPMIQREFRRVVGMLLERPQLLTSSGMLEFVANLIDIATALELQGSILKVQLYCLILTYSPLLCHIVLMIYSHFMDAFEGEEESIFKRIMLLCNDPRQALTVRLLAVHWLLGLENLHLSKHKKSVLASMALRLYPLIYDPLSLKALKLDSLAYCAACVQPSPGLYQGIQSIASQMPGDLKQEAAATKLFKDGAICVSAYRWLPSWSSETRLMFRMLHRYLTVEIPSSHMEEADAAKPTSSILFKTLQGQIVSLALQLPRLVSCVLMLVDRLLQCETHRNLGEHLLQTFNMDLLSQTAPNQYLPAYFPIFERIAESCSIPPKALIQLLTEYMQNQVVVVANENSRTWLCGSQVLLICRTIMVNHPSSRVFHPLSSLLAFLVTYFPDIDVRDSARMYLRMLISIPGKKLRSILKYGDEWIEDSSAPQVSSLLQSSSPVLPGSKRSSEVASYIHLSRVTPLLVGQSWSLVLHDLFKNGSSANTESVGPNPIVSQDVPPNNIDKEEVEELPLHVEENLLLTDEAIEADAHLPEEVVILQDYFTSIPDYQGGAGLKVKVHCHLSYSCQLQSCKEESSPRSTIAGPDFSEPWPALYAIVLSFSSSGPYRKIPSVHIPFLPSEPSKSSQEDVGADSSSRELLVVGQQAAVGPDDEGTGQQVPELNKVLLSSKGDPSVEGSSMSDPFDLEDFRELVIVELEPKQPVPTVVDSYIVTSDKDGRIIQGALDSIHIGIEDLFAKATIPSHVEDADRAVFSLNLFNALWETCGAGSPLQGRSFFLNGGKEGISIVGTESVKLLESHADRVLDAIEHHLAPFVVSVSGSQLVSILKDSGILKDVIWQEEVESTGNRGRYLAIAYNLPPEKSITLTDQSYDSERHDEAGPSEVLRENLGSLRILIFVPPRFHILFRMDVSDWSTRIHIRTDHWPCLAYVDEYLEALVFSR